MYCAPSFPMWFSVHSFTQECTFHNTQNVGHNTHHSPLKSNVVSDASELRLSRIDCAPMSPMLFSVDTHTHSIINTHTTMWSKHQTSNKAHYSNLVLSVMSRTWDHHQWIVLQCLQSCCLYIHTHTHTHTQSRTVHHTHTSLTIQIQCRKRCEWLETITNTLWSNVPNAVVCTSSTHKRIQLTHTLYHHQ